MFGRNRRLATEHVITAIRPLIAVFQNYNGLPAHFWQDEFVLGFISFMISFHANYTSGLKLSQEDKGQLLYDVLTALSNMNGQTIGRECTRLSMLIEKRPDFERGADNASICAFASMGKMTEQGLASYNQAKEIAAAQGKPNDLDAVVVILFEMLFTQALRERFGL